MRRFGAGIGPLYYVLSTVFRPTIVVRGIWGRNRPTFAANVPPPTTLLTQKKTPQNTIACSRVPVQTLLRCDACCRSYEAGLGYPALISTDRVEKSLSGCLSGPHSGILPSGSWFAGCGCRRSSHLCGSCCTPVTHPCVRVPEGFAGSPSQHSELCSCAWAASGHFSSRLG